MFNQSANSAELEEDTLELELTAEQALGLSQAAEKARLAASVKAASLPVPKTRAVSVPTPAVPARQSVGRSGTRLWPLLLAVSSLTAVVTWRLTSWLTPQTSGPAVTPRETPTVAPPRAAPPPLTTSSAPVEFHASTPEQLPDPPVQVRNPFDHTEVFEFPAGTSKADARAKMSEILLQRARGRDGRGAHD